MLSTIQVYVEALVAFALMSTFSIIAGFIAAAVTGDRAFSIAAALVMFTASGAVLAVRLWRMANRTA
jgi:hypothetical protein